MIDCNDFGDPDFFDIVSIRLTWLAFSEISQQLFDCHGLSTAIQVPQRMNTHNISDHLTLFLAPLARSNFQLSCEIWIDAKFDTFMFL